MNWYSNATRRTTAMMLCVGLTLGLSGCRKKPRVPPLPQITAPIAVETPPALGEQPMLEAKAPELPPTPVASAAATPKRERKKSAPVKSQPVTPDPVQVASAEPPPETAAIGALTAGGEANPRTQQEATDLIASIEKRLNALPSQVSEDQKTQISKVRNFQRQAQEALNSGDAEGAKTLATKAKLLLDDLVK